MILFRRANITKRFNTIQKQLYFMINLGTQQWRIHILFEQGQMFQKPEPA
jgi:hypothetical protein